LQDSQMIKDLINDYLEYFPDEKEKLILALNQANQAKSDDEIIDRKNFTGHFIASAFVVSLQDKTVLLLNHKSLNLLLQPGGHIDQGENPFQAAIRELKEETGLDSNNLEYYPFEPENNLLPFNINSHFIPENKKENEPGHYHYAFEYLFFANSERNIRIDLAESTDFQWASWEDFFAQKHTKKSACKIEKLLTRKLAKSK